MGRIDQMIHEGLKESPSAFSLGTDKKGRIYS